MTLNEQEWAEVEQLVDGEYMTQVEDAGEEAALAGVKLAMAVLQACPIQNKSLVKLRQQALDYLSQFGNYEESPIKDILTKEDLHTLHVKQYGSEEEANANLALDLLYGRLQRSPHSELWHHDAQDIWHQLSMMYVGQTKSYYYEQAKDIITIRDDLDNPYLESRDLDELIRQVRDQYKVEIYDIPVEQWTFSPDVKEEVHSA